MVTRRAAPSSSLAANDASPKVLRVVRKRTPLSPHLQIQIDLDALCADNNVTMRPLAGGLFFAAPLELLDRRQLWSHSRAIAVTCCLAEELAALDECVRKTRFFDRLICDPHTSSGTVYAYKPNWRVIDNAAHEVDVCDDAYAQTVLSMLAVARQNDVFLAFGDDYLVANKNRRDLTPSNVLSADLEAQRNALMTVHAAGQMRP